MPLPRWSQSAMLAIVGLTWMSAGCREVLPPDQAFDAVAQAAERGDREAFLDGFTPPSRALLDGLLAISDAKSKAFPLGDLAGTVRAREFSVQGEGVALVLVQTSDEPPELAQIVMRLDRGQWRIDLVSTELMWNRSWELSGRARRGDGMPLDFGPLDSFEPQR